MTFTGTKKSPAVTIASTLKFLECHQIFSIILTFFFFIYRSLSIRLVRASILGTKWTSWFSSAGWRIFVRCFQWTTSRCGTLHSNIGTTTWNSHTRRSIEDERQNWTWYEIFLSFHEISIYLFGEFAGVTLSRESDGVWLYNRSASPVFVHSSTLCDMDSRTTTVHKVPPGHCLRAFDPLKWDDLTFSNIQVFLNYFHQILESTNRSRGLHLFVASNSVPSIHTVFESVLSKAGASITHGRTWQPVHAGLKFFSVEMASTVLAGDITYNLDL